MYLQMYICTKEIVFQLNVNIIYAAFFFSFVFLFLYFFSALEYKKRTL